MIMLFMNYRISHSYAHVIVIIIIMIIICFLNRADKTH